jgi:hypothetical protein
VPLQSQPPSESRTDFQQGHSNAPHP